MRITFFVLLALGAVACTDGGEDTADVGTDTAYTGMRVRQAEAGWRFVPPDDIPERPGRH